MNATDALFSVVNCCLNMIGRSNTPEINQVRLAALCIHVNSIRHANICETSAIDQMQAMIETEARFKGLVVRYVI